MIVKKVKFIQNIQMWGGSIDKFEIVDKDGNKYNRITDIWYIALDAIPNSFYETFRDIDNLTEAFSMWSDELIKNGRTNYSKEELMSTWLHWKERYFERIKSN